MRCQRTIGIELVGILTVPKDGGKTHSQGDGTNTIVDITSLLHGLRIVQIEREKGFTHGRAHSQGSDTSHILDGLSCPSELSDDLFVGQVGERLRKKCQIKA